MDRETVASKIDDLKRKNNAIILAHNYQIPDVQDIADFIGDSFGLSVQATKTDAEVIIFCGVDFMAESAKILNPDKMIILPDKKASCPMAAMIDRKSLKEMKIDRPDAVVVAYVNTTAEVKAEADICCTSANAVDIVNSVKEKEVIFIPDKNLGFYVERFVKNKEIVLWPGFCPTHHEIRLDEILKLKKRHPDAEIIVHPECTPKVIDIADYAYSTEGMVKHVSKSSVKEFIIGTEKGLCYRLKKESPSKTFYPLENAICPPMKRVTLEKVLKSLENLKPRIDLSEEIIEKAKLPLKRMVDIGRRGGVG